MTIIIFIIILGLLVLVHELGHFLVAKKAGVRVEEFGFGYPPRAISLGKKWGTLFSINWIPFGGFVKIFGENYETQEGGSPQESFSSESPRISSPAEAGSARLSSENFPAGSKSFAQVSRKWQAAILVAGITFNIIFAWFLFSFGFMIGLPTPAENTFGAEVKNPVLTVVGILPDSPADIAGLKTGDKIKSISSSNGEIPINLVPEKVSDFINDSSGEVSLEIDRGGKILDFSLEPKKDLVENKKLIGIGMDMVGTLSLPIHKAVYEGGKATLKITYLTVAGLLNMIKNAVMWKADISQIAGPVGIVGLVGDASRLGFAYLVTFTALISINLAIINLMPFPALDGGRLLFVAIEGVTKRPINQRFAEITNTVGFAILIALMIFVTYRDILKLF